MKQQKQCRPVHRASQSEKARMQHLAIDETEMAKDVHVDTKEWPAEPGEPYVYKVMLVSGWYQLNAHRSDNGEMADSSYHMTVERCGECGGLIAVDGSDFTWCSHCKTMFEN